MHIRLLTTFVFVMLVGNATASEIYIPSTTATVTQVFFVSGVLKRNDDDFTIKLVHAVERATSRQEALAHFVRQATVDYPNYTMVDVLVSSTKDDSSMTCLQPDSGMSI